MIFAGHGFVRRKIAAQEGSLADHLVEKSRSHEISLDSLRAFAGSEIEAGIVGGAHELEHGVFVLPIEIVTGGNDILIARYFDQTITS